MELSTCPFCGTKPTPDWRGIPGAAVVIACPKCGATGPPVPVDKSKELGDYIWTAILLWNGRK
jgi:hypothetical protein